MPRKKVEQETFMKKYLTTEVKYIISIIAFVWWIAVPYFWIKQDIAIIKQNHMAHMENFAKDIAKLYETQNKQQDMIIQLMKEMSKK